MHCAVRHIGGGHGRDRGSVSASRAQCSVNDMRLVTSGPRIDAAGVSGVHGAAATATRGADLGACGVVPAGRIRVLSAAAARSGTGITCDDIALDVVASSVHRTSCGGCCC